MLYFFCKEHSIQSSCQDLTLLRTQVLYLLPFFETISILFLIMSNVGIYLQIENNLIKIQDHQSGKSDLGSGLREVIILLRNHNSKLSWTNFWISTASSVSNESLRIDYKLKLALLIISCKPSIIFSPWTLKVLTFMLIIVHRNSWSRSGLEPWGQVKLFVPHGHIAFYNLFLNVHQLCLLALLHINLLWISMPDTVETGARYWPNA